MISGFWVFFFRVLEILLRDVGFFFLGFLGNVGFRDLGF